VNADGVDDVIIGASRENSGWLTQAGSVSVYSGQDGNVLLHVNGDRDRGWFGYSVSNAGDTNGDGFDDVLVGEPGSISASNFVGAVSVISGRDGTSLFQVYGPSSSVEFGKVISGAGDLNSDGFADFLVRSGGRYHKGSVVAYSGADASVLYRWQGLGFGWDDFGNSMAAAGDVNGDGFDDVLISASQMNFHGVSGAGVVFLVSGATGLPLFTWGGEQQGDEFGKSVAGAGDVDGDGCFDVVVGASFSSPGGQYSAGTVVVLSGSTGSLIHRWEGIGVGDQFGFATAIAGDVNGDGLEDVLVGVPYEGEKGPNNVGAVYLFSVNTGEILQKLRGSVPGGYFGQGVCGAKDLNGDGLSDLVISGNSGFLMGAVFVYSFNPYLISTTTTIPISMATQVDFVLDFPNRAAFYGYKVLLSASGPGQMFRGVDIPLTEDFLVHETYYGNYPFANYTNLHGTLNLNGDATATINIAAHELHPSLIGRTIYAAAAASVNGFTPAEFSSVAIPMEITP
jgi:hypothetical protein